MKLVAVVGPTATGKSALALDLARRFNGEIVACDSTAVYRGIDIGTDKVPVDAQQGIPHHMVDVAEPAEVYSAARYACDAAATLHAIAARGRLPVLVGGTGFYYRALVRGIFPGPARDAALRARRCSEQNRDHPESEHPRNRADPAFDQGKRRRSRGPVPFKGGETTAGMILSPAILAARRRRSPSCRM